MKKILFLSSLAMLFVLIIAGCTTKTAIYELGETIQLKSGEIATIQSPALTIKFIKFVPEQEIDCPPGNMCLGPRPAYYVLAINGKKQEIGSATVNLQQDIILSVDQEHSGKNKITMTLYRKNECTNIVYSRARADCMIEKNESLACLTIDDSIDLSRCVINYLISDKAQQLVNKTSIRTLCKEAQVNMPRTDCLCAYYLLQAKKSLDYNNCFQCSSPESIAECLDSIAIRKNDGTICARIIQKGQEEKRDNCYLRISKSTKEKSWCDKIVSDSYKHFCLNP